MKKPSLKSKIILLCLSFIFIFAVIEICCRLFYNEEENYGNYNWRDYHFLNNDSDRYVNKVTGLIYNTKDNLLNDRYKRFEKVSEIKAPEKPRIIILGDSFSAGFGVKDMKDTYIEQLKELLKQQPIQNISEFEVLSFSDGGLNTEQELAIYEQVAINYDPDMVILQYCSNDVGGTRSPLGINNDNTTKNQLFIDSETDYILLEDKIVPAFSFFDYTTNRFLLKESAFLRFISYKYNIIQTKKEDSYKRSFDSVKSMIELSKSRNIPFIIIYFPLSYRDYDFCNISTVSDLTQLAETFNTTLLNMCDYADIHAIKSEIESPNENGHYNKEGYRIAATVLKEEILKELTDSER
jgi:lysophospholipase L1-like esterase